MTFVKKHSELNLSSLGRRLKNALRSLQPSLNECAQKRQQHWPNNLDAILLEVTDLLIAVNDLGSLLVAAAESEDPVYLRSLRFLRTLAYLEWDKSGDSAFVGIPYGLLFCLHHLVGAVALFNGNCSVAVKIANTKVPMPNNDAHRVALWSDTHLTGWADVFHRNCKWAFEFLFRAFQMLPLVRQVFPDERSFRVSLGAYNWLLALCQMVHQPIGELTNPPKNMVGGRALRWNSPSDVFQIEAK